MTEPTKPRRCLGRRRLAAGWVLLVFAAASLAAWVGSIFVETTWSRDQWTLQCVNGVLYVYWEQPLRTQTFRFEELQPSPSWWMGVGRRTSDNPKNLFADLRLGFVGGYHLTSTVRGVFDQWGFAAVIYPFTIGAALGGWMLVQSGRRARVRASRGVCVGYGYDLAGLAAGAGCPECGRGG